MVIFHLPGGEGEAESGAAEASRHNDQQQPLEQDRHERPGCDPRGLEGAGGTSGWHGEPEAAG